MSATTEERTVVLMMRPRFKPAILAGIKRHTIRRERKTPPKPGDMLSIREWTGKPYRSPQQVILESRCKRVVPITVNADPFANMLDVSIDGVPQCGPEFARLDGFNCVSDMCRYYLEQRTLSFDGILIEWFPVVATS